MRTYASSRVKRKSFYRKSELQMFFYLFPEAILVHQNGTPIWRLHAYEALQRCGNVSANNSERVGHKDLDKLFIY